MMQSRPLQTWRERAEELESECAKATLQRDDLYRALAEVVEVMTESAIECIALDNARKSLAAVPAPPDPRQQALDDMAKDAQELGLTYDEPKAKA